MKQGLYVPYYQKVQEFIQEGGLRMGFQRVRRAQNQEADDLSKAPLKAAGIKFRIQPEPEKRATVLIECRVVELPVKHGCIIDKEHKRAFLLP